MTNVRDSPAGKNQDPCAELQCKYFNNWSYFWRSRTDGPVQKYSLSTSDLAPDWSLRENSILQVDGKGNKNLNFVDLVGTQLRNRVRWRGWSIDQLFHERPYYCYVAQSFMIYDQLELMDIEILKTNSSMWTQLSTLISRAVNNSFLPSSNSCLRNILKDLCSLFPVVRKVFEPLHLICLLLLEMLDWNLCILALELR